MDRHNFKIILTVSPLFIRSRAFNEILSRKDIIYRINGSHINALILEEIVKRIKKGNRNAETLLDLPGNKIRVRCKKPIRLHAGKCFRLGRDNVSNKLFFRNINKGDLLFAQDSTLSFEVVNKRSDKAVFMAKISGLLHNNKGLHKKYITKGISFISERDRDLIRKAHKAGVASLGVSYARSAEDIRSLRDCLPPGYRPRLYIKIETAMAIENLKDIMDQGECFIVDRGDLASEIGLSNIPAAQARIVEKMLRNSKKIFLATQFLKNMINQPVPLIAEVNDIAAVFNKGISGIQLSEETAIGKYPLNCVELITAMKKNYYKLSR